MTNFGLQVNLNVKIPHQDISIVSRLSTNQGNRGLFSPETTRQCLAEKKCVAGYCLQPGKGHVMDETLASSFWRLDLSPRVKLALLALVQTADDHGICARHADAMLHLTGLGVNGIAMIMHYLVATQRVVILSENDDGTHNYALVMDDLPTGGII